MARRGVPKQAPACRTNPSTYSFLDAGLIPGAAVGVAEETRALAASRPLETINHPRSNTLIFSAPPPISLQAHHFSPPQRGIARLCVEAQCRLLSNRRGYQSSELWRSHVSNRSRFLVGSAALVILASGLIAPDSFVSVVYAEKDKRSSVDNVTITNTSSNPVPVIVQGGPGSSTKTLVELVFTGLPSSLTPIYTVPAGQRLILTDLFTECGAIGGNLMFLYRNDTQVARISFDRNYQSGIEFREGTVVGIATKSFCGSGSFYELRGYMEPL